MGHHDANSLLYYRTCFAINVVQYALELGVFVEIATNVLKPVRRFLPAGNHLYSARLHGRHCRRRILLRCASERSSSHIHAPSSSLIRAVAILQVLTFILIAAFLAGAGTHLEKPRPAAGVRPGLLRGHYPDRRAWPTAIFAPALNMQQSTGRSAFWRCRLPLFTVLLVLLFCA